MLHRLLGLVIILVQITTASRPQAADPEEISNRQHNSNQNQHNIAAPVLKSLRSPESYEFDSDSDEKPKKKTHKNIITDLNEKSFQDKLKSNDRFQGVLEQRGAMLVEKFRPWENPNILSLITPAHPVVTRSPYVYP